MKKITFLTILISWLLPTFTMAQLTISPVHSIEKSICPGEYTYTLDNKGESCVYTMTAFDQKTVQIGTSSNGTLKVTWEDRPGKVRIDVKKTSGNSSCNPDRPFEMIIHSVTGLSPKIEGCKDLVIGKKVTHQLTANLAYELGVNKGSSDTDLKECKEYEWKLSDDTNSGWSIKTFSSGITTNNKFCDVTTDVANDGTVMVRGKIIVTNGVTGQNVQLNDS